MSRPTARPTARRSRRGFRILVSSLALSLAGGGAARAGASEVDREDLLFVSEHLLESVQDHRFASLPLPAVTEAAGAWKPVVGVGYGTTDSGFLRVRGTLLGLGLGYQASERWQLAGLGFWDSFDFGGGSGRDGLIPLFAAGIPLELPANADLSRPRGEVRHWGLGGALTWRTPARADGRRPWSLTGGVLWSRLEARGFEIDYRLADGASAGATGVLDLSAGYSFVAPFFRLRTTRPLGARFALSPQAVVVVPLPRRGFAGRLTGPGFDLAGDSGEAGHGQPMGDTYVGLGVELEHLSSHLAVDLGATLYLPLYERLVHAGLDRSWMIQLVWRGGR